ncbi:MAG: nucleotide pyrophosphohydrolase [Lachnospiraceae bacterium]|jgi:tetrapyrrole methylase family protein/MazG family protein|nr:nucleotide pyrophosphohydrolase [Lachnospiraceae bacterium]
MKEDRNGHIFQPPLHSDFSGEVEAALERYDFNDLQKIIRRLCAPDGCPWDRIQTHETLISCLRDETEEAAQAIENGDMENLCEELGDVLLLVLMHSEIARKRGTFTLADVIQGISEKMIRRHPHVFGDARADTLEESLLLWKEIKKQEKAQKERQNTGERPKSLDKPGCSEYK